MLNGIPNRRGRPSVKTSVHHNTKPKHWCIYNSTGITNQTINYDLYNTDGEGVIKIQEEEKVKGARCKCMTGVNGSVTGIALGDI